MRIHVHLLTQRPELFSNNHFYAVHVNSVLAQTNRLLSFAVFVHADINLERSFASRRNLQGISLKDVGLVSIRGERFQVYQLELGQIPAPVSG